ncbi:MAG: L-serine ammonia-lyase, iron-sulfur-dependent, subunit alpha [Bacilli bacterium]|jgi:L-serine dehydratase
MKSLKELLIIGPGPSSSHTIGPHRICLSFLKKLPSTDDIDRFEITLYGSLALTGKGHSTDSIIKEVFSEYPCQVIFNTTETHLKHPNTMQCVCIYRNGKIFKKRYLSIGGGAFQEEDGVYDPKEVYPFNTFGELRKYMSKRRMTDMYEVIEKLEDKDIFEYGDNLMRKSFMTIESSLKKTGYLPGPLHLNDVSKEIYKRALACPSCAEKRILLLTAYAYATSEANARGEMVVTNPTCGSSGVVPAVLYYEFRVHHYAMKRLVKSYLVGALVCNIIKQNASLSGALLGCQAEIGSAAAFAAASLSYLHNLSVHQIEYASEVAMEHFLGLTCDPVDGYVQIPCIERNGMAAIHAYAAFLFAKDISPYRVNRVSFDNVIKAMNMTGKEIPSDLKETSLGGLAKVIS